MCKPLDIPTLSSISRTMAPALRPPTLPPWNPIMAGVYDYYDDSKKGYDSSAESSPRASSSVEKPTYTVDEVDLKGFDGELASKHVYESDDIERRRGNVPDASMETIALRALHVDDDPTLNPWTFRMFFIGKFQLIHRTSANLENRKLTD